jgi:hypothetical protein
VDLETIAQLVRTRSTASHFLFALLAVLGTRWNALVSS